MSSNMSKSDSARIQSSQVTTPAALDECCLNTISRLEEVKTCPPVDLLLERSLQLIATPKPHLQILLRQPNRPSLRETEALLGER